HVHCSAESFWTVFIPPDQRRLKAQKRKALLPVSLCHERGPDSFAFWSRLDQPMRPQFVEHGNVGGGNALNRLRQQVGSQLVRDRLADQPECVVSQPT